MASDKADEGVRVRIEIPISVAQQFAERARGTGRTVEDVIADAVTDAASRQPPYVYREFPRWMYRADGGFLEERIVQDATEHDALGPGWYGNPGEARRAAGWRHLTERQG